MGSIASMRRFRTEADLPSSQVFARLCIEGLSGLMGSLKPSPSRGVIIVCMDGLGDSRIGVDVENWPVWVVVGKIKERGPVEPV